MQQAVWRDDPTHPTDVRFERPEQRVVFLNQLGVLNVRPSDDWGEWVIGGATYRGDPAMRVELPPPVFAAGAAEQAGQRVFINYYVQGGVNMLTLVRAMPSAVYLPATVR